MAVEISVSDARAELGPVTSRVEYGGETVYLTKHGRRAVAVVPAAAAELLEEIEDLMDAEAVEVALAALRAGTDQRVRFTRRTPRTSS
jgi:prevent-host-death family protein